MRKLLLFITGCISFSYSFAQNPDDVIRNAWFVPNGSARSNAIGGAMGALGGDVTASYTNPAGLGFYKTKEVVLSPGFLLNNNKSDFRGTSANGINKSGFQLGPTGVVIGGKIDDKGRSSAFSISFNQLAGYNNKIHYQGLNDTTSYSEHFAEELVANGADTNAAANNYPFGSSLAYFTYLIDYTLDSSGNLSGYRSLVPVGNGNIINQQYDETDGGGLYEISVGFASNSKDKLYLGGSINIPLSFFTQDITYQESDAGTDQHNNFSYSVYTQNHSMNGIGINGRFGIIYNLQNSLRLGFAFHTPSFMSFTDRLDAAMTTNTEDYKGTQTAKSSDFSNAEREVKYNEITPYKFIASAAYVFKEVENVKLQKGFISADIEYVNHRGSRFIQQTNDNGNTDPSLDNYYTSLNDAVKSYYKGAFNFRLGGELKFSPFAVRFGGAYYGSPYADKALKANNVVVGGGLGYRKYGMFVDITVNQLINKDVNFPYRLADKPNTFATLKNQRTNISLTIGVKF